MTVKQKSPPSFTKTNVMTAGNRDTVNVSFSFDGMKQAPNITYDNHFAYGTKTEKTRHIRENDFTDFMGYRFRDPILLVNELFDQTAVKDKGAKDFVVRVPVDNFGSMKIIVQTKDRNDVGYKLAVAELLDNFFDACDARKPYVSHGKTFGPT